MVAQYPDTMPSTQTLSILWHAIVTKSYEMLLFLLRILMQLKWSTMVMLVLKNQNFYIAELLITFDERKFDILDCIFES